MNILSVGKDRIMKSYVCLPKVFDIHPVGKEKPSEAIQPANDSKLSAGGTLATVCVKEGKLAEDQIGDTNLLIQIKFIIILNVFSKHGIASQNLPQGPQIHSRPP